MSNGEVMQQLSPPKSYVMCCVPLSADLWAVGGWGHDVALFDLSHSPPVLVGKLKGHVNSVRTMTATSNGRILVTGGHDSEIKIWDCVTLACLCTLKGHSGYVLNLEVRECNDQDRLYIDTLVSSGTEGRARVWRWVSSASGPEEFKTPSLENVVSCSPQDLTGEASDQIYTMALDRERRWIICGGFKGRCAIYDEDSGRLLRSIVHPSVVSFMKYDKSRQLLVTACNDSGVRIFDLRRVLDPSVDDSELLCGRLAHSNEVVYHIDFDEDILVMTNASGKDPCTVLWDFRPNAGGSRESSSPSSLFGGIRSPWLIYTTLSIAVVIISVALLHLGTKGGSK